MITRTEPCTEFCTREKTGSCMVCEAWEKRDLFLSRAPVFLGVLLVVLVAVCLPASWQQGVTVLGLAMNAAGVYLMLTSDGLREAGFFEPWPRWLRDSRLFEARCQRPALYGALLLFGGFVLQFAAAL